MKVPHFTVIHIRKSDYLRLPASLRKIDNGPMVLSKVNGRAMFLPAAFV